MSTLNEVKAILEDVLQLGARSRQWNAETALLGSVPELDSMAVVTVLTAFEESFGIQVGDDEIDADTFATLGSLAQFVDQKKAG